MMRTLVQQLGAAAFMNLVLCLVIDLLRFVSLYNGVFGQLWGVISSILIMVLFADVPVMLGGLVLAWFRITLLPLALLAWARQYPRLVSGLAASSMGVRPMQPQREAHQQQQQHSMEEAIAAAARDLFGGGRAGRGGGGGGGGGGRTSRQARGNGQQQAQQGGRRGGKVLGFDVPPGYGPHSPPLELSPCDPIVRHSPNSYFGTPSSVASRSGAHPPGHASTRPVGAGVGAGAGAGAGAGVGSMPKATPQTHAQHTPRPPTSMPSTAGKQPRRPAGAQKRQARATARRRHRKQHT